METVYEIVKINDNSPWVIKNGKTGDTSRVAVHNSKEFRTFVKEGDKGYPELNEGKNGVIWLNDWISFDAEVQELPKEIKQDLEQIKFSSNNGARTGMIVNNAVLIAIEEMKINNSKQVNLSRIREIVERFDKMFGE